jgi:hypothetical protein
MNPELLYTPFVVRSPVSLDSLRQFVAILEGQPVSVTIANFSDLSLLSKEFGLTSFDRHLSAFRLSSSFSAYLLRVHAQALASVRSLPDSLFTLVVNGVQLELKTADAASISPAVALQLSVDACSRRFTLRDDRLSPSVLSALRGLLSGDCHLAGSDDLGRLLPQLSNFALERAFIRAPPFSSESLSLLSADALDALLAEGSVPLESEDSLFFALLALGPEYFPLLRHVRWDFLSPEWLPALAERTAPSEAVWRDPRFLKSLLLPNCPNPLRSTIVSDFPEILSEFRSKVFTLLYQATRDGFRDQTFHSRCDSHANTLCLILDTNGNIFGGFTPLTWDSSNYAHSVTWKSDPTSKGFLFTLKNPHHIAPMKFMLKSAGRDRAIGCQSGLGPNFGDLAVCLSNNLNPRGNWSAIGSIYRNGTAVDGRALLTGSMCFTVQEMEVFALTERSNP